MISCTKDTENNALPTKLMHGSGVQLHMTKCGESGQCPLIVDSTIHTLDTHLHHKPLVDVLLGNGRLEVRRFKKTKKELVDDL